jgi:hypothetical protein
MTRLIDADKLIAWATERRRTSSIDANYADARAMADILEIIESGAFAPDEPNGWIKFGLAPNEDPELRCRCQLGGKAEYVAVYRDSGSTVWFGVCQYCLKRNEHQLPKETP